MTRHRDLNSDRPLGKYRSGVGGVLFWRWIEDADTWLSAVALNA